MCGKFPVPRQNPGPKARPRQNSQSPGRSTEWGRASSLPGPGWLAGASCGSLPGVLAHTAPQWPSWEPRAWGPSGREGPRMTKATVPLLVGGPTIPLKKWPPSSLRPPEPPIWCPPASTSLGEGGASFLNYLHGQEMDQPLNTPPPDPSCPPASPGGHGVPGHTPTPDLAWPSLGVFTTQTACEPGTSECDLQVLGA